MPDSLSSPLACGDSVCFYAKVSRPFSEKELTGFDYGDYLLRKGISGTALAYAGNWRCTGKPHSLSFMQRAKVCQQKVVDVYQSWGLEEDVQAVVSALTIGEKSELTPELKRCTARQVPVTYWRCRDCMWGFFHVFFCGCFIRWLI